jgi:hypothetical protein
VSTPASTHQSTPLKTAGNTPRSGRFSGPVLFNNIQLMRQA